MKKLITLWLLTVKYNSVQTEPSEKRDSENTFTTETGMKTYEEKNGKIDKHTDEDLLYYSRYCLTEKQCDSKILLLKIENLEPKSMKLRGLFFVERFCYWFEKLTKTLDSIHKIEGLEKTIDRYKKLEMLGLAIDDSKDFQDCKDCKDFQSLKARIHSKLHSSTKTNTKTKVLFAAAVIAGILSVTAFSFSNYFRNDQSGYNGGGGNITHDQKQKIKEIINQMQITDDEKNKLLQMLDSEEDLSRILSGIEPPTLVNAINTIQIKNPEVQRRVNEVQTELLSNEEVLNESFIQNMLSEDKLKGGKRRTKRNKKSNKKRNKKSNRKRRA